MAQLDKVLYTAHAHTTGGREGASRTDDGRLDIQLSSPGGAGKGTNPEQLFAAGYSACFIGAMKAVAARQKITLPADLSVDAEVDLGPVGEVFGIAVRMKISLPGMDKAAAQQLVDAAHKVCPYSNATRGNIGRRIAGQRQLPYLEDRQVLDHCQQLVHSLSQRQPSRIVAQGHMGYIAPARRGLHGHQRRMQALQAFLPPADTQIGHGGEAANPRDLHGKRAKPQALQHGDISAQRQPVIFPRRMLIPSPAQPPIGQRDMRLARMARQQGITESGSGLLQQGLQVRALQHHHPDGAPGAALMPLCKIPVLAGL